VALDGINGALSNAMDVEVVKNRLREINRLKNSLTLRNTLGV
jgi:hypothetical protein